MRLCQEVFVMTSFSKVIIESLPFVVLLNVSSIVTSKISGETIYLTILALQDQHIEWESINLGVCFSQEADGSLPYLLVLCGDHGMSETGSHGGSSEPEVNTPLVLISPAFKRKGKLSSVVSTYRPMNMCLGMT